MHGFLRNLRTWRQISGEEGEKGERNGSWISTESDLVTKWREGEKENVPQKKVHGFFSESETGTKFKKMEEEGVKNAPWLPFFGNSYISERII